MSTPIIIPAHMDSKRFPGKPLVMIAGRTLVQHVYERAKQTKASKVVVTTCDDEIEKVVSSFGGQVVRTAKVHLTGTHRVAEALDQIAGRLTQQTIWTFKGDPDLVINWQVDEPFIDPNDVNELIERSEAIGDNRVWDIETIVAPCEHPWNYHDVKVVTSRGKCYWFSRAPMNGAVYHTGIYAYSPKILRELSLLKPTELSKTESLEQLAWIESSYSIGCVHSSIAPVSVNVRSDLDKAERVVEKCQSE